MRRTILVFIWLVAAACGGGGSGGGGSPEDHGPLDVTGTFEYFGVGPYWLRGTITFEQTGDQVAVTETVYHNSRDRPLIGTGTLVGNVLEIALVPENGDTNYRADVVFTFAGDGETFEVGFEDTNGDDGSTGSYVGVRLTP